MNEKIIGKSFLPTYLFLCMMNLFLFTLGIRLYGEPFSFRHHHFSELGNIHTPSGYSNIPSQIVFTLQMIFNGMYFFHIGNKIQHTDCRQYRLYQAFSRTAGTGMLLIVIPYGINNFVHSLGMVVMSVCILVMNTITFIESRHKQNDSAVKHVCVLSWALLLVYAVLCGMDHPAKFAVQKPAVLILGIYCLAVSPYIEKLSFEEAKELAVTKEEELAENTVLRKTADSDN